MLDLGADGILVPLVKTPAEAKAAVSACKYPPEVTRGFAPRRASDYGRSTEALWRKPAKARLSCYRSSILKLRETSTLS